MFAENEQATQEVTRMAAEACRELFEAYGVPFAGSERLPPRAEDILYCGVMGFVGRELRGMCLLGTAGAPLENSRPAQGDLRDWLGELTNQLVGRIKTKLLAHGVDISLTTPLVLRGEHIAPLPRKFLNPVILSSTSGSLLLWVETETVPTFSLNEDGATQLLAREGEVLIF